MTTTVTAGATGKVTFYDGVTILGIGTLSGGQASITTVMLPSGTRKLRAYYQGDGAYASSSSVTQPQTVTTRASLGLRPPLSYPTPKVNSAVAVGDFNGDGRQDLAIANSVANSVTVYLGNGDGTFQSGIVSAVGGRPVSLAIADFNGDGRMDLAVANYLSGNVSILLGNGDGTLQAAVTYPAGTGACTVAVADFDADGKADLVVADADWGGAGVSVLLGNGDGTFQNATPAGASEYTTSVAVADFNGDGKTDLVTASGTFNEVAVLLGNGDGTFQTAHSVLAPTDGVYTVATSDFNNDGHADIVEVSPNATGAYVLLGNGDGTFRPPRYSAADGSTANIVAEDFDGDGKEDLGLVFAGSVGLYLGNGDGAFGNASLYDTWGLLNRAAAGDFNGDGRVDLAFAGPTGFAVLVGGALPDLAIGASHGSGFTLGQQGATYTVTVTNAGDYASFGTVGVAAALPEGFTATSLSGKGWGCVLATLTCTRSDSLAPGAAYPIILKVNIGNGLTGNVTSTFAVVGGGVLDTSNDSISDTTFLRFPSTTSLTASPNPSTAGQAVTMTVTVTAGATGLVNLYNGTTLIGSSAADVGHNSFTTSLLPSGLTSLRAVYLGDSNYGPSDSPMIMQVVHPVVVDGAHIPTTYGVDVLPWWIVTGDLNRDGKADLITANHGNYSASVSILLGNGDGTYLPASNYALGNCSVPTSPLVEDLNNDGIPDVVVACESGIYLFPGNGGGSLRAAQKLGPWGGFSNTIATADFNGDGIPDLVGLSAGSLVLMLGNGDGTFQPAMGVGPPDALYGYLNVADMNADGRPDLVVATSSSIANPTASIFLGNGDGSFHAPVTTSLAVVYYIAMTVGDFNGDGKPDLVVTNGAQAGVLVGNGDGTLKSPVWSLVTGFSGSQVISGDFNGDGKLDIAYTAYTTPTICLAFGNGDGTFQPGAALPTKAAAGGVTVGDFNGDGKPDLAVLDGLVEVFLGGQFSGLTVSTAQMGDFIAGQTGSYQITVTDLEFASVTGVVTVTDTLPSGLVATAFSGNGWSCTLSPLACTRTDSIGSGVSYPPITLAVSIAADLPPSNLTNQVSVSNGGKINTVTVTTATVLATATALALSPNPSIFGQPVTLSATVTAATTGSVLFLGNGLSLGSAIVNAGQAVLTTRLLPSGLQSLIAGYSGDDTHAPSASAATYQMVKASPANAFSMPVSYPTGAGPSAVASGDFNRDGNTDLVIANSTANTVSILLGSGDGTFGPNTDYAVGTRPVAVVVADFNGDGQPDIAVANASTNYVSILLGNPDGTFQTATSFPAGSNPFYLAISDFNGDGKADLVVQGSGESSRMLLGNGDGTFQPVVVFSVPLVVISPFAVGDFDSDGRIDLFAGSGLLLGRGDGTFQTNRVMNGDQFNSMVAGDLNGDGKLDAVGATDFGVIVFLGNGDGTFQPAVFYGNVHPTSVLMADVNGDGKLDVVTADTTSNRLDVFLGNGDGTLQPAASIPVGTVGPNSIVAGDFNGEGRTDLAMTNSTGGVTILLGELTPTLTVASSHTDPFAIGQTNAYAITVTNTGPGVTSGQVKIVDTLPSGLTATNILGTGWTCTLATLTCTTAASLSANASYSSVIVSVSATAVGSGTNQVTVSGGGAANTTASDPTTIVGPPITIQTNPAGLQFTIDGGSAQTAPATVNLAPGAHTLAAISTQAGTPGIQYVFTGWSDSGVASLAITVGATPATYTATFKTQYQLTAAAFPLPGGTITPASGTYVDAGSTVNLTASPNDPYVFTSWTGGATANPWQFTMNAPRSFTAAFSVSGFTCAVTGDITASVTDAQQIVNEALGVTQASHDLNRDNQVNVADIQKVIGAILGSGCIY